MTNIFFVKKQKSNRHQTHNKRHKSLSKFFSLRFIDSRDCSKCRVTHSFFFFFFFVRGNVCLTLSLVFATKNFFVCDKFSPIAHFLRKSATFDRHSFEPRRSNRIIIRTLRLLSITSTCSRCQVLLAYKSVYDYAN